jgi:hypothetical protein
MGSSEPIHRKGFTSLKRNVIPVGGGYISHVVPMPYLLPLPFYYVTLRKINCSKHMAMKLDQQWLKTNKDIGIIHNNKGVKRHKTETTYCCPVLSTESNRNL